MAPVRHEVDLFRPMYQIIRRINLGVDVHTVLSVLTQGVVDVVGFQVAAISWLTDALDFEIVSVAGRDDAREQLMGTRVSLAEMEAELRASDQSGCLFFLPAGRLGEAAGGWIPDVSDVAPQPGKWLGEDTLRCLLRSPEGELLGVLSVDLPDDGLRPTAARRELLEMYADLAGLALNQARRATALEERVRLSGAVQAALLSTDADHDPARLVATSASAFSSVLRASTLWVRVIDPQNPGHPGEVAAVPAGTVPLASPEVLAHAAADARAAWDAGVVATAFLRDGRWASSTSAWSETPERIRVVEGRAGWVRRSTSEPIPISEDQAGLMQFLEAVGASSLLMCPVGVGSDCFGYFVACRDDESVWSDEEIEASARLGRHLGQAVLSVRLLERERVLVQQLEALDGYKNDLVSTVSHELRTPLTSVVGHLELIEDAVTAGVQVGDNAFEVVQRNLRRVLRLTDELLTLKRIDAAAGTDPGILDLRLVARDVVASLQPQADAQRVSLRLAPHGGPVLITGNGAELERVVLNLVDNAIKYTPAGGVVEVSIERTARFVRLVVADSGIGISPGDQEELFAEFFRSTNPTALAVTGTGLGLSIVRRIVQRHGGSIRVTSAPGEGSTFTVRLPLSHTRDA
ncbi:MAG: hypothetical protein CMJ44_19870 [Pimelobacter sp.]|nr:hypothetical protein [Pimelobacter sp.]